MGLEWQGCCYLSGGWTQGGNGEEYSPMGGDTGRMGTQQINSLELYRLGSDCEVALSMGFQKKV